MKNFQVGDRVEAVRSTVRLPDHPPPPRPVAKGDRGTVVRMNPHYSGIPSPVVHWDKYDVFIDRGGTKQSWLRVINPLQQLAEQAE